MVMESRKLLSQRKKYYQGSFANNKTQQKTKDFDKLPPIKNSALPSNQISHNNSVTTENMPPIILPSWCTKINNNYNKTSYRIRTHSPDDYSNKVIEQQCTIKKGPSLPMENPPSRDVMRLSKDCWFEEEEMNMTLTTNNETIDCWRQLPRPERWRWRHHDIITTSSSQSPSQRLVTITKTTTRTRSSSSSTTAENKNKIDIHDSKNVYKDIRRGGGGDVSNGGGSSCCSGSGNNCGSWGVKRRNGFKTARSAVSSYLKVRRRDSNTSALTIFSICEQLCRLNNTLNSKGNRKHSNLVASSSRKNKRNILPVSLIDEYLFRIVQKAWKTPTPSATPSVTQQAFHQIFKRLKMNKDRRSPQSTAITTTTTNNTLEMTENNKTTTSSSPTWSPILMRRRLSVPEIIMRKYALTRDRSRSNSNNSEESLSSLLPIDKNTHAGGYHCHNLTINNNNKSPNRRSWNINDRTSGSDGDLSTLLRDTNSSRSMRGRRGCVDNNTSQIHKSALLRRFWNKELQRNHSVDVIYSPSISKKLSPTRFTSRLRENVLVNNSIRREKFCSTSDLNDNVLRIHSGNAGTNSTPNISIIDENHPQRSLCSSSLATGGLSMDYPYSCLTTAKTDKSIEESDDDFNTGGKKVILVAEHIENISKSIVKNMGEAASAVNVLSGSVYKPVESHNETLIPRYSAIPRTASMEVGVSSGECQTEDSDDMISLVDSLEDAASPRFQNHGDQTDSFVSSCVQTPKSPAHQRLNKKIDYDSRPVRGDIRDSFSEDDNKVISLHPSASPKRKSDAFFLQIDNNHITKVDENPAVVNRLPKRIEAKIHKRQAVIAKHKRLRTTKNSFHLISSKVSSNACDKVSDDTKPPNKTKKRNKLLKELQLMESFKIDSHGNMQMLTNMNNKENNWIKRSELHNSEHNTFRRRNVVDRHRPQADDVRIKSNLTFVAPNQHDNIVKAPERAESKHQTYLCNPIKQTQQVRSTTEDKTTSKDQSKMITTTKSNLTFVTPSINLHHTTTEQENPGLKHKLKSNETHQQRGRGSDTSRIDEQTKLNVTVTTHECECANNSHQIKSSGDNNYLSFTTMQNNNSITNPRRIYQKTELNNAGKKIEILEIVECPDDTDEDNAKRKFNNNKLFKSKIPIPVLPVAPKIMEPIKNEESYCLDCNPRLQKTMDKDDDASDGEDVVRLDQKPINIMRAIVAPSIVNEKNPGVDRLIAGILIGNMNNPTSNQPRTFESIPEEDHVIKHDDHELILNNNIDNKNIDLNKNSQKLYRTHVTLIMKTPNVVKDSAVQKCSCKRTVKDVATNTENSVKKATSVSTVNIVKEVATNTDAKKIVKKNVENKHQNIVKHSCVKPDIQTKSNKTKVVNKNVQTIDTCDNSTQTVQQEATASQCCVTTSQININNKITSKETQTTECTHREEPPVQTTTTATLSHRCQPSLGVIDDQSVTPNGWKSFYHLELDHERICNDDESKVNVEGESARHSCSMPPPAGLKNETDFIEKLNKYRRNLRKPQETFASIAPPPPPLQEYDHAKLKVFDDEIDNDSELYCGVDSENATTITTAATSKRYKDHRTTASTLFSLKKQPKKMHHSHCRKIIDKEFVDDKKKDSVCGWSITVSGTNNNNSKITPDLKMRLKFPTNNNQVAKFDKRQSDSGIGDENCSNQFYYPSKSNNIIVDNDDYDDDDDDNDNRGAVVKLKTMSKSHRSKMHHSFSSNAVPQSTNHLQNKLKFPCLPNVNKVQRLSTKPTKTSSTADIITTKERTLIRNKKGINSIRYRPSGLRQMKSNSGRWSYTEEIKYIDPPPGSLAIMGSTISPEQKPKVTTMSERDLTWRLLHTPNSLYHRY